MAASMPYGEVRVTFLLLRCTCETIVNKGDLGNDDPSFARNNVNEKKACQVIMTF